MSPFNCQLLNSCTFTFDGMKTFPLLKALLLFVFIPIATIATAQKPVNWTKEQLLEPAVLAQAITNAKNPYTIISIGPGALIPGSIDVGATDNPATLHKLKSELSKIKKDKPVVVYCGCCPFAYCPNVRPAIEMLKQQNFTNYKLLNLPRSIKADWLDKGYPRVTL